MDGLAGVLVPHDGGLTLVGDADGGDVRGGDAQVLHGLLRHFQLGGPDLLGVMLDPAGLGEELGELLLGHTAHLALFIEQDAAVAGGARVQRHYVLSHTCVPPLKIDFLYVESRPFAPAGPPAGRRPNRGTLLLTTIITGRWGKSIRQPEGIV